MFSIDIILFEVGHILLTIVINALYIYIYIFFVDTTKIFKFQIYYSNFAHLRSLS